MTYLQDSYKKFLNKGNAPLAANVSLIYVPTTTRIDGADAVASHVRRQASIVEKQSEEIINVIESSNALCLDIEVTLKFNGGGAYLPAMDDNFLADSVANISTVNSPRSRSLGFSKSTILANAASCSSTSSNSMPRTRFSRFEFTGTKLRSSRQSRSSVGTLVLGPSVMARNRSDYSGTLRL